MLWKIFPFLCRWSTFIIYPIVSIYFTLLEIITELQVPLGMFKKIIAFSEQHHSLSLKKEDDIFLSHT